MGRNDVNIWYLHYNNERNTSIKNEHLRFSTPNWTDKAICQFAWFNGNWEIRKEYLPHVREAKRRGLSCGVSEASSQSTTQSSTSSTTSTPSKADMSKAFCGGADFVMMGFSQNIQINWGLSSFHLTQAISNFKVESTFERRSEQCHLRLLLFSYEAVKKGRSLKRL